MSQTERQYTLKIYEKEDKVSIYKKIANVGYMFWIGVLIYFYSGWDFPYVKVFLLVGSLLFLLYSIIIGVTSYFRYAPLLGRFDGEIIFKKNSISIKNEVILVDEIEKIEFFCEDYVGQYLDTSYEGEGKLSQGVDNSVEIKLKNSKIKCVQVLLMRKHQIREIEEFLIYYCQKKILHRLHLMGILGLGYDQIQEYKKKYDL